MNTFPPAEELTAHPDRIRWNNRYQERFMSGTGSDDPIGLLDQIASFSPSPGPVLELAGGPSMMALFLAKAGRLVTVVDISDTALTQLAGKAHEHGVADRLTLVHADLTTWTPPKNTRFAITLCRLFWDTEVFRRACRHVASGGLLAWEALALDEHTAARSHGHPAWRLKPGEPCAFLPEDFTVVAEADLEHHGEPVRRMIAVRAADPAITRD